MLVMLKPSRNEGEALNLFVGQSNYKLVDEGIEDAKGAATALEHYDFDYVFCSDSEAAMETWDIIKQRAPFLAHKTPTLCPQFKDRSGGILEGLDWKDIRKQLPPRKYKLWERDFTEAPEMGESLVDVEDRAIRMIAKRIKPLLDSKPPTNILVIADGVVISLIIKRLQRLSDDETKAIYPQSGVPYFHHGDLKL